MRIYAVLALLLLLLLTSCGGGMQPPAQIGAPGVPGDGTGNGHDGGGTGSPSGPALTDVLAYVKRTGTGDEIWLRSNEDHSFFWRPAVPPEQQSALEIGSLAWRPDGRALAFTSNHERHCSVYSSDVYTIASDAGSLERVTNSPGCDGLADCPTGRVVLTVVNAGTTGGFYQVYLQGASSLQQVSLSPGAAGTVVFEEVADLGDVLQPAVAISGGLRWVLAAGADVQAGRTVEAAGVLYVGGPGIEGLGAHQVRWGQDGSTLAYIYGNCASLQMVPAAAAPGSSSSALFVGSAEDREVCAFDRGPTAETAHLYLYHSVNWWSAEDNGIFLANEDRSIDRRVVEVLEPGYGETIRDVAWLPDGSGFLFSGYLYPDDPDDTSYVTPDLFLHDLTSGETRKLLDFEMEQVGKIAIAPDGGSVVFELLTDPWEAGDLWELTFATGQLSQVASQAGAPAWTR